jgi:hypothetical protein
MESRVERRMEQDGEHAVVSRENSRTKSRLVRQSYG